MSQLLIITLILAVPAPKPKADEKTELAALLGTWEVVSTEADGKTLDREARKAFSKETPLLKTLIIEKDGIFKICLDDDDSGATGDLPYKIDFSTTPRIVRWNLVRNAGLDDYGIYTIEKDTLKLAVHLKEVQSKENIPKEFKTKKDDGNYIYIFKRVKGK